MPTEITMPQLSDTMTEGTVVKWHKKEGEKVRAGEEIADVETDKATMPMEAFEAGTLALMAAKEGDKVPVGGLLAVLATGDEDPATVKKEFQGKKAAKSKTAAPVTAGAAASTAAGAGKVPPPAPDSGSEHSMESGSAGELHESAGVGHHARSQDASVTMSEPKARTPKTGGNGQDGRTKASPLARRIASEKGIDLQQVQGSGPGGRIVQRDVLEFKPTAKAPAGAPAKKGPPPISLAPKIAAGQKETLPLSKIRTVIAQRLQQSKQNIPHFYETIDIDVEDLSRLRAQMNRALEVEGVRLSIGDLVAKGIAHALQIHPALNAHFNGGEIVRHGDVNLGIAVALPEGLIVPVLRGVNGMGLRDIRTRSADLVERARKQNLKQNELSGATFTVSNLGTHGIREFSAIINPPEVGILAVGAAEPRPVVRDGQVVVRTMMTVTLSADHRAVDGATAAEFLQTLKVLLEQPGMMLV